MNALSIGVRSRLAAERGFTIVELMVAVSVGMVVILFTFNLLDAAGRASTEVSDRVDSVQRGRVAMEQVTQRLRSQVCLDSNTPAVTYGDDDELRFYSELGDEVFTPEARRLRFDDPDGDGFGDLNESVWTTLSSPPGDTFSTPATSSRNVLAGMMRALEDDPATQNNEGRAVGDPVPVFRYYTFLLNAPNSPTVRLQTPLSVADRARVVRIAVAFESLPARRSGAPAGRQPVDTRYENDVFVRTADPTDPEHSPQCL